MSPEESNGKAWPTGDTPSVAGGVPVTGGIQPPGDIRPPGSMRPPGSIRPPAPFMADLKPYDPRYLPARIYLNANESPYGMPSAVSRQLAEALAAETTALGLNRYPAPLAEGLRQRLADRLGLQPGQLLIGNGGDELIADLVLAWGGHGRRMLIAPPCFSSYANSAALNGTEVVSVPRDANLQVDEQAIIQRLQAGDIDLVILTSPNNPTGDCLRAGFVQQLLAATDAPVLIDQAYVEFADPQYDLLPLLADYQNLAVLRTFSKAWGLAGLRLGYLYAAPELIRELQKVRQPYSVDRFAPLAADIILCAQDQYAGYLQSLISERDRLYQQLSQFNGLRVYASQANFLLVQLPEASRLWQWLYDQQGILVRDFSAEPGLPGCLRISVGTPTENDQLLATLRQYFNVDKSPAGQGQATQPEGEPLSKAKNLSETGVRL